MKIKRDKVMGLMDSSNGRICTAVFIKKDGTPRKMVCRTAVSKGVTGKGMAYNPRLKGLLPVYDMQDKAFKMINTKTTKSIRLGGVYYDVV